MVSRVPGGCLCGPGLPATVGTAGFSGAWREGRRRGRDSTRGREWTPPTSPRVRSLPESRRRLNRTPLVSVPRDGWSGVGVPPSVSHFRSSARGSPSLPVGVGDAESKRKPSRSESVVGGVFSDTYS